MAATRREPRRVRRARKRAAYYAHQARLVDDAAGRMRVAEQELLSAIRRAPRSARAARSVTGDAVEHARHLMDDHGAAAALARHEDKYGRAGTDVARAGVALMWLRAAVGSAPTEQRDGLFEHYTTEFAREAARIRGER